MRRYFALVSLVLFVTLLGNFQARSAGAQNLPSVVIETDSNCAPAFPTSCRVFLVNRSTNSRAVANLQRRVVSNFPPTMYDRQLLRIMEGDSEFEVLLSAGARVPLVPAIAVALQNGATPGLYVRYQYTVLGSHPPGPDDIADDESPNVADYFRLVVEHNPAFDNTDACRIGAIAHPAKLLRPINFHPTKTIVITHRNVAARYGSSPQFRVDVIPPGGGANVTAMGCETDVAPGSIEFREVRFM